MAGGHTSAARELQESSRVRSVHTGTRGHSKYIPSTRGLYQMSDRFGQPDSVPRDAHCTKEEHFGKLEFVPREWKSPRFHRQAFVSPVGTVSSLIRNCFLPGPWTPRHMPTVGWSQGPRHTPTVGFHRPSGRGSVLRVPRDAHCTKEEHFSKPEFVPREGKSPRLHRQAFVSPVGTVSSLIKKCFLLGS